MKQRKVVSKKEPELVNNRMRNRPTENTVMTKDLIS